MEVKMTVTFEQTITQVSIDDVKRNLSLYLQRVEAGETVIVLRAGQPVAEIKPVTLEAARRPYGLCAGEFVTPDDFDDPLPASVLQEFEG
jgi:prevent-host-death family protein